MGGILLLGAGRHSTGPALWTPNNEAGLLGWWDLSDSGSSFSSGTWTKRWGTLNNITSDSTAPSLISTGFSGDKYALSFNGNSNNGMTISSPNLLEAVFVLVMNVTAVAGGVFPLVLNRASLGVATQGVQIYENYGLACSYRSGTKAEEYTATIPGQLLMVCQTSTALRELRNNGAVFDTEASAAGGSAPASSDAIRISRYTGSAQNWQHQLAAFGVFTAASYGTSLAEKIEGFVAHNNLGVTTAILPGGHTYKSTAPTV